MRVDWLGDTLRSAGCTVIELDGWQGRGKPLTSIYGVVQHHTATPKSTPDANIAKLLRDGRKDLAGPLSQMGLDRQGRWWLITDGKANHNGFGEWGNASLGVEAFNDGKGEPWPEVQLRAWERGTAAICAHLGFPAKMVKAHRETDPRRKIDPFGIGMDAHRDTIARLLHPPHPVPEDDMRFPVTGYLALTINQNGKGVLGVPQLRFDQVTGCTVKANDDGSVTGAVVEPWSALDGSLMISATGKPGTVGVIVSHLA